MNAFDDPDSPPPGAPPPGAPPPDAPPPERPPPEPLEIRLDRRNFAPLAAVFEAGLGAVALLAGWLTGVAPGATLDLSVRTGASRAAAVGWGLAASLPPLALLYLLQRSSWRPLVEFREKIRRHVLPWFARSTLAEFAILSLAAGVGEELLFRGWLQTWFVGWFAPGPLAIPFGLALSSLIFAACHALDRIYFVLALLMSLYLGAVYLLVDDLAAPIVTHAVYDFVALAWLTRRRGRTARRRAA